MPKSLFNASEGRLSNDPRVLTREDVDQVSGGRFKIQGGPAVTVFYDDGITLVTSDPSKNTLNTL